MNKRIVIFQSTECTADENKIIDYFIRKFMRANCVLEVLEMPDSDCSGEMKQACTSILKADAAVFTFNARREKSDITLQTYCLMGGTPRYAMPGNSEIDGSMVVKKILNSYFGARCFHSEGIGADFDGDSTAKCHTLADIKEECFSYKLNHTTGEMRLEFRNSDGHRISRIIDLGNILKHADSLSNRDLPHNIWKAVVYSNFIDMATISVNSLEVCLPNHVRECLIQAAGEFCDRRLGWE